MTLTQAERSTRWRARKGKGHINLDLDLVDLAQYLKDEGVLSKEQAALGDRHILERGLEKHVAGLIFRNRVAHLQRD